MSTQLDWLIVGGGIHGVHLAARLLEERRTTPERLTILDPEPQLLSRWETCTRRTGMSHLRSPVVHHLDIDPFSLLRFAEKQGSSPEGVPPFVPPYNRPSLELFQAHSAAVIARYDLQARHHRGRAAAIALDCSEARVTLDDGTVLAGRRLLLAIGASEQPRWPGWAQALHAEGAKIVHVLAPDVTSTLDALPERVAVLGAGISGAQVALRLARTGRQVTLIARGALREHQFDSDPGWLGPRFLRDFHAEPRLEVRRQLIQEARHRGSMPSDVRAALGMAFQQDLITFRQGEVQRAVLRGEQLHLTAGYRVTTAGALVLATGLETSRPGGALVDQLVESYALPCAQCGYPRVDSLLRWHPRIVVTGPLAELALGPAARNIAGARHAGDRIAALT